MSVQPEAETQRPRFGAGSPAANGVLAIVFANTLWGGFPLLFHMLQGVPADLIVAHRIVWALLILSIVLALSGRGAELRAILADRRLLLRLVVSSAILAVNWLLYVITVETGRVLEASFGYFITPLVSVALGMVLLRERISRWQAVAISIAAIALGIQAMSLGGLPWLSVGLALSFGVYGFLRKTMPVASATGLFAETAVLFVPALGFIGFTIATQGMGPHADAWQLLLLMTTGLFSVVSLVAFAYGAQRLPLSLVGMFQYIAPSLQFVVAVALLGEEVTPLRLSSFALIWVSLMIVSWDSLRRRSVMP